MKAFGWALFVAGLGMAGWAGRAAWRFLPSLNEAPPGIEVVALHGHTERPARRVVLVIVDGLRLDASRGLPFLDRLRARGVDGEARAPYPTLSQPSQVAMLTGVSPRFSGVRTNDVTGPVALDSLLAHVRAAGMRVGYVSDRAAVLPARFPVDESAVGEDMEAAVASMLPRVELLIVLVMEVDRAGHEHGGASQAYRDAARRVDARLERMLGGVELERDAVVVTSDHGQFDRGGHGGLGREVEVVPLIRAGAGTAGTRAERLEDVAGMIGGLLGLGY